MGGDHAPASVIEGASIARERHPDLKFLLVGNREQVEPLLSSRKNLGGNAEILHTETFIAGDAKPSLALRQGGGTSMRLAIEAVASGRAEGVVSAGNTGALMVLSKFVLRTLPGVDRPAIASLYPTLRGESAMLDMGANVECDARNLFQFGVMGSAYVTALLGIPRPRVGLLNIGSEDLKGHDALRAAAAHFREIGEALPLEFHGFIEGNDITGGTVDVVVTDGFSGNIAIKMGEGTIKMFSEYLKSAYRSSLLAKLGYLLSAPALSTLKKKLDPRHYNGGVLLGLNGVVVKSHGGADGLSFANAVSVAYDLIGFKLNEKISAELKLPALSPSIASD
ncbi:MAG: phosphate acyltransferase PlsX [Alphaproteobacteria bacterium]|nr:phosphate acyltransferase PlsX [Alphaproteobacteria bacterium]